MKKLKILTVILTVILFAFFANTGFSQTKDESHAKLKVHNEKVIKANGDIASGTAKTKEEKVKKADEATASLTGQKRTCKFEPEGSRTSRSSSQTSS
jgi:hypothetical protein